MAQQINEITKIPSNSQVIKILNQIIRRYNNLSCIYTFKGSVQTYDDLLAIQNPDTGDVYNVIQKDEEHQIAAGSNFVWDGTVWDNLGGSLAGLVQSVNGINPDSLGNVLLPLIKSISTNQGVLTITKNDNSTEQFNDIKKLYMLVLDKNINLNDLTESGTYLCANDADAANYENCPIQKAFLLEVQATVQGNFIFQFLTQYNDGSTEAGSQYIRTCYDNNWSAWRMTGSNSLGNAAYKDLTDNENFLGRVPLIADDGIMEIGQYIDFHIQDSTQTDFDVRIQALSDDLAVQIPSLSKTISLAELAGKSSWTMSEGTNGWARESSTGFTIQWGDSTVKTVTFPRGFSTKPYIILPVMMVNKKEFWAADTYIGSVSTTSFTYTGTTYRRVWIAIGIS